MGVFNSISFSCPRCDASIEVQSKADGGCASISCREVPRVIANDIEGEKVWCEACSRTFTVVRRPQTDVVDMALL